MKLEGDLGAAEHRRDRVIDGCLGLRNLGVYPVPGQPVAFGTNFKATPFMQ